MNNDVEKYQELLDKLELAKPISEDIQKYAIKSGDRNLRIILKKTGYYSVFFAVLLSLLRWIRNIGISATFFKSKIVLTILSANIASALIIGSQYVAEKYILEKPQNEIYDRLNEIPGAGRIEKPVRQTVSVKKRSGITATEIGIQPFSGDSEAVKTITSKIASNLSRAIGADNVTFIKKDKKVKIDRILMGSVRTFGDTKYITARIVNVKDSSVENVFSEEYKSEKGLNEACDRIVDKISEKMKKIK